MKRLLPLLLVALLLTGCGGQAAPQGDSIPLSVSMEAEGVMGRSYTLDVPLPEAVTPMEQGGDSNV